MRKKVKIHVLSNGYREILDAINSGFVYVGKNQEVVVLINKQGQNREYKGIAYSILTCNVARFEMNINELKEMHNDFLSKIMEEQYKLEDDEDDMIEEFENISNALVALQKGSYKNYRVTRV